MWVWSGRSLEPHQTLTLCYVKEKLVWKALGGGAIINNAERLMKERILQKLLVKGDITRRHVLM